MADCNFVSVSNLLISTESLYMNNLYIDSKRRGTFSKTALGVNDLRRRKVVEIMDNSPIAENNNLYESDDNSSLSDSFDNYTDYYSHTWKYLQRTHRFCGFWDLFCRKCERFNVSSLKQQAVCTYGNQKVKERLATITNKTQGMKKKVNNAQNHCNTSSHKSNKTAIVTGNRCDKSSSKLNPVNQDGSASVTYEIPVYFGDLRKWVKGVDNRTTSLEVVTAILSESGIDLYCAKEYFIVVEFEPGDQQTILDEDELILPWWQKARQNGRLILTAQRLYVNINKNDDERQSNDNTELLARHRLFSHLSEQMDILNKQRKTMERLDEELKRLNSNDFFTLSVNKNRVLNHYNKLSDMLNDQSEQMKRCENQLNFRSSIMDGAGRIENQSNNLTHELQRAEKRSHRLSEELYSITMAEQELDRLLNLKRRHFCEVERLLHRRNHLCENDISETSSLSSCDLKLISVPTSTIAATAATTSLDSGECKHQVYFKIGPMSPCKAMKFDGTECVCFNALDDDSDTGVSSMNSDESGLNNLGNSQCNSNESQNVKSKTKSLLETLV
ncbi:hypothetical protein GJ496_011959 [Pomphorhynchus laevis]|nr:hypothetical protein GJ496_011959 [Pomphorhynchus laevis]